MTRDRCKTLGRRRGGLIGTGSPEIGTLNVYDGGHVNNTFAGKIITATVTGNGGISNSGNATIDSITVTGNYGNGTTGTPSVVNGGGLRNYGNAAIGTATVTGSGQVQNSGNATIGTATVTGDGLLRNYESARIGSLFHNSGTVFNSSTIDNLTYIGGIYYAYISGTGGTIGALTVAGDSSAIDWGNLAWASVNNGGILANGDSNTIVNAIMNGGALNNAGMVDNLTYNSGSYSGTGTIGSLAIAGNARGIDWGVVENIDIQSTGAVGDFTLSGGAVSNAGTIDALTVTDGRATNSGSASVATASVTGNGMIQNFDNADIGNVTVAESGVIQNSSNANIGAANVTGSGLVQNSGNASVDTATVAGSGLVQNSDYASMTTATVTETGLVQNFGNANIGIATVSGSGIVQNYGNASIDALSLNGGLVSNGSRIEDLTYNSGFYTGTYADNAGTIGTLILAGDSIGIDWGTVDNLQFSSSGNGILSIAAFVEEPTGVSNSRARNIEPANIQFTGINADKIDFTDGNIVFDMSGLASLDSSDSFFGLFDDGFALSPLFGGASIEGELNFFQITLGEEFGWGEELFFFLNDDGSDFAGSWNFINSGTEIVWGEFSGDGNVVPEPATLAILGLGLVGLGLARRRRK